MKTPAIVSLQEWEAARQQLLVKEKELTRTRDALGRHGGDAAGDAVTRKVTAKHAHASMADVQVATGDGILHVHVRDDGRGGAHFTGGSGLVGLKDRAEALGGRIWLHSPPGAGTSVQVSLPLGGPSVPGLPAGQTMPAVTRQPIPGRPAQREKYDGSRDAAPRVMNVRLTQAHARRLRPAGS
jgi:hypothetical protein